MSPAAKAAAYRNLASGFLISARLAFLAGDHGEQRRMEKLGHAYEAEADLIDRAEAEARHAA